ncbi:MAG TPA: DNA-binding domain-containing protein [Burkholderiales bacterium]|nr:DNA-binding domain-containing protein [Burkholderiales bacterium]
MPALRDTQEEFAAALLGAGPHRFDRRLQVYRNNVLVSLSQALADVYPVLVRLVGMEYFFQAARRFVRQHPSRSGNLHDFGGELARFLATLPETPAFPYLSDVAALEWAWHEALHADEAAALDVVRLAKVPEHAIEGLRFRLHPAARLVASRYPVLAIWEANREGAPSDSAVSLDAGPDWLLITRPGLERAIERLTPGAFTLLITLASGSTIADACDAARAAEPNIDLQATVARFVGGRVIADVVSDGVEQ